MLTKQEIFNKAVEGIATQNYERSMLYGSMCGYRGGPDGKFKCAVGQLIPDDLYNSFGYIEEQPVTELPDDLLNLIGIDPDDYETLRFVSDLQTQHDTGETRKRMIENLTMFGEDEGLELPEVLLKETENGI